MNQEFELRAEWLARHILPHEPALRRWLWRLSSPAVEIDDLIQETYGVLAAMDKVDHVRDPRAYFFTTARSLLLQQVRRARIVAIESMAEVERLDISNDDEGIESRLSMRQQLQQLAIQIARLPDKCREAFVLRKIEGCSQREIAARMGISESTVEKHIGSGLRQLMKAMSDPQTQIPAAASSSTSAVARLEQGEP